MVLFRILGREEDIARYGSVYQNHNSWEAKTENHKFKSNQGYTEAQSHLELHSESLSQSIDFFFRWTMGD